MSCIDICVWGNVHTFIKILCCDIVVRIFGQKIIIVGICFNKDKYIISVTAVMNIYYVSAARKWIECVDSLNSPGTVSNLEYFYDL